MGVRKTLDNFITGSKNIHGNKYDYSTVIYDRSDIKVCIICPEHGEFWQRPSDHLSGKGCKYCSGCVEFRPDLSHIKTPKGSRAVPLTAGKYALVDEEDYERVMQYRFRLNGKYAYNDKLSYLHRFIMNCPKGMVVDHINHNTLDCRKSNLRVCTHQQNLMNMKSNKKGTSKYKGVSYRPEGNKWESCIRINNKTIHLGLFNDEIEAAMAYNKKAKEVFKGFCNLNVL